MTPEETILEEIHRTYQPALQARLAESITLDLIDRLNRATQEAQPTMKMHYALDNDYPNGRISCTCSRGIDHTEELFDVPMTTDAHQAGLELFESLTTPTPNVCHGCEFCTEATK